MPTRSFCSPRATPVPSPSLRSVLLSAGITLSLLAAAPTATAAQRPAEAPSPPRSPRAFTLAPVERVPPGAAVVPAAFIEALRTGPAQQLAAGIPLDDRTTADLSLWEVPLLAGGVRIEAAQRLADGSIVVTPVAPPALRCFRGTVAGLDGSEVFIAVGDALFGGFVRLPEGTRFLSGGPVAAAEDRAGVRHPPLAFDPARLPEALRPAGLPFCHSDGLQQPPAPPQREFAAPVAARSGNAVCRSIGVAIETDSAFTVSLFGGNLQQAAAYALALTAASSEVFDLDVGVTLRPAYLRLWVGDDPWDAPNMFDQLFQFRDHWESVMQDVPRDLAHFYSGRPLGGGVAWLPGLCGSFNYALSANLGGFFPYPIIDYSHQNWDLMVVTHEFGHNLGSPHTHSVDPPLDNCGNGDCSIGGIGTIMSYCHICPGGLSNVAMRFHPGSIASMQALLDAVPCDYDGSETAIAGEDFGTGLAGAMIEVDVLANDLGAFCSEVTLGSADATTAGGFPVEAFEGTDGRLRLRVTPSFAFVGGDQFSYEIEDGYGNIATGEVMLEWVPLRAAVPVVGAVPGVVAHYFEIPPSEVLPNFTLLEPYASEVVASIDYPSTNGPFAGSGRADLVAATFEGWLEVPASGWWRLFTDSDDGSRLWIGETLVVENDGLHGMVERSGEIALAAGRHPIRVEFFENFGGAGLIVRMQGPATPKQVVPAARWSHGGTLRIGDLDGNGVVDGADLAILLGAWGPCPGCAADLNGDGLVSGADLGILLGDWG